MNDWLNVRDFGALGDGTTDDTKSIIRAIAAANKPSSAAEERLASGVVYFPAGIYRVSESISVTDGKFYGCRLEGANAENVKVIPLPGMAEDDKIFVFRGGSGRFTNAGIKNMTIGYDSERYSAQTSCTGVYIDGQNFGIFENLRLKGLKYGVWLHNNSKGTFGELNQFHQLELSYCQNGIRIEQGGGNDSFHGNDFNNCYFKIGANQIGFNHRSGFLYNARFRLFMWATSESSVYLNADGNATDNIGDITYESFKRGKITGKGRFWFNGFLRGIPPNGFKDETQRTNGWEKVVACDNYWKPAPYADSGMNAGPLDAPTNAFNGPTGFFQSLKKGEVTSVLLNTYNGSGANGLYLGRSGFQQGEAEAKLGLFISGGGDKIKSYHPQPLAIENAQGIAFGVGGTRGFKMLAGRVVLPGGNNRHRWQEVLTFEHLIGGRLFILDREDHPVLTTIVDVTWNNNTEEIKPVGEVLHKNQDRQENLKARVRTKASPSLQVGANFRNDTEVYWYFHGLVL